MPVCPAGRPSGGCAACSGCATHEKGARRISRKAAGRCVPQGPADFLAGNRGHVNVRRFGFQRNMAEKTGFIAERFSFENILRPERRGLPADIFKSKTLQGYPALGQNTGIFLFILQQLSVSGEFSARKSSAEAKADGFLPLFRIPCLERLRGGVPRGGGLRRRGSGRWRLLF